MKQVLRVCRINESERNEETFDRIRRTKGFENFDASKFVFPDALTFIKTHGKDCIVITSAASVDAVNNVEIEKEKIFQEQKITESGIRDLVSDVYVVYGSKSECLKKFVVQYGMDSVFVDDRENYIREGQQAGIMSILMKRDVDTAHDGEISSFTELEKVVSLIQKGKARMV